MIEEYKFKDPHKACRYIHRQYYQMNTIKQFEGCLYVYNTDTEEAYKILYWGTLEESLEDIAQYKQARSQLSAIERN